MKMTTNDDLALAAMSRGTGVFADALAERDAATLAASATLIADYVSANAPDVWQRATDRATVLLLEPMIDPAWNGTADELMCLAVLAVDRWADGQRANQAARAAHMAAVVRLVLSVAVEALTGDRS